MAIETNLQGGPLDQLINTFGYMQKNKTGQTKDIAWVDVEI